MEPQFLKEALTFAKDPLTSDAFLCGLVAGYVAGFVIGALSIKYLYLGIRMTIDYFASRRAERQRKESECREARQRFAELRRTERQRKETERRAEQERQEEEQIRKEIECRAEQKRKAAEQKIEQHHQAVANASRGLHHNAQGLFMDGVNHIYCPDCIADGVRSVAQQNSIGDIYCPRCGWQCPVFFGQIIP